MRPSPERHVLFNESSLTFGDYSLVNFQFLTQATITAVGLQFDDVITFEVMLLKAGAYGKTNDCIVIPDKMPEIMGTEKLMCFECGDGTGEEPRPVRLTASNPTVVLNAPQGAIIRAHYEGSGLGTAEVWVTLDTDTPLPLVPGMDGCPGTCCVDTEWQENGVQRCNLETDMLERQEISNCDNLRWSEIRPLNWQDTGAIRCVEHVEEKQQTNDCGDLRWIPTGTSCGWIPTYELPCGGLAFRPEDDRDPDANVEIDGCAEGEVAYLYPEPMPWANKPIVDCEECAGGGNVIGYAFEDGRAACDPCEGDPGAWVRTGVRRWDGSSGATEYGVERQEVNGCGHYDWKDDGTLPWVDTGAFRCVGDEVQREQTTEFGQTRWILKEPTFWRRDGEERCILVGTSTYQVWRKELNQCNDSRWVQDRLEDWQDTGAIRCSTSNDVDIEKQQTTICGDLRWILSNQVQVWSDTGSRSCNAENVLRHESNDCGRLRKTVETPVEWVETGVKKCEAPIDEAGYPDWAAGYYLFLQETNQCGDLRWTEKKFRQDDDRDNPWPPTTTGVYAYDIYSEKPLEQSVTECGQIGWSAIDPLWLPTGAERCLNHVVQLEEREHFSGFMRWVDTSTACGYLPTYQLPCGGLAFRPTDLRDPGATVVMEDCDGNPQAYIYPTAREGASTPVTDCNSPCPDNPTVLGYATDSCTTCSDCGPSTDPVAVGTVQIEDQIFTLWSNGSKTLLY